MSSPRNGSISSIAQRMQRLRISDPSEKGLLVRIGTLVDAIVTSQRGSSNAPGSIQRKANVNNLKKPQPLTGSTENIFNGASVTIDPTNSSVNLSHYEVQVDSDPHFANPTIKEVFTTGTVLKGLDQGTTYNLRIRPITKNGQIGDWAILNPVTTTPASVSADFDGANLGEADVSKSFTFTNSAQQVYCGSNLGAQLFALNSITTGLAGQVASIPIGSTEVIAEILRNSTVVEAILFEGIAPNSVTDNGTGAQATLDFRFTRQYPLVFFDLIDPETDVTFPTSYTFTVKVSIAGGAFTTNTGDTTWVQF
jgi:hypothetical protein